MRPMNAVERLRSTYAAMLDLHKGRVRSHTRRTATGMTTVSEHARQPHPHPGVTTPLHHAILQSVARRSPSTHGSGSHVPHEVIFEDTREHHGGHIGHFHQALRDLADHGLVRPSPFTGPAYKHDHDHLSYNRGGEIVKYARPTDNGQQAAAHPFDHAAHHANEIGRLRERIAHHEAEHARLTEAAGATPKKAKPAVDHGLVKQHVDRITAAFGNDKEFGAAHAELARHPRHHVDAVAAALGVKGRSKKDALARIGARHNVLVGARAREANRDGRTAA